MSDPTAAATGSAATQEVGDYVTSSEHQEGKKDKARSLWSDAWHDLRKRPMFLTAIAAICFLIIVAVFPWLFTDESPRLRDLDRSRIPPNTQAIAVYLMLAASLATVVAGALTVLAGSRDGLTKKFAPIFAFFGGGAMVVSTFFAESLSYRVLGLLALVIGALGMLPGTKRFVGVGTRGEGWPVGAGRLLAAGLLIACGLTAGISSIADLADAPAGALFGYDQQGQDIYARVVYGTRWTLMVGVFATTLAVLIGGTVGILAGYFGGWADSVLSRIGEVFFGLPFVLGAIVILSAFRSAGFDSAPAIVSMVVLSISVLSWPIAMRIMRSAAISAKQQDYVKAARALGASHTRIIFKHLLPNCLAPVLVYATIALGAFIGAEATLSFLGIGLRDPAVSWGVMISDSRDYIRASPYLLLFPAGFLTITVLAFVMLGDAVREALDPKMK